MKLTPRLEKIATLVDEGSSVIDVGTDHGYIPLYLIKNNLVKNCIAADINEGPLNAAKETLDSFGIKSKVELRLGSGLTVLHNNEEIDTVVIAGMGGETIISILEERIESIGHFTLILQPMTEVMAVREYLTKMGWDIVDENIAKESLRFYEIIKAKKSNKPINLSLKELRFGPILLKKMEPEYIHFLKRQYEKNTIVLSNVMSGTGTEEKISELQKDRKLIEEVLQEIESTRDYSTN